MATTYNPVTVTAKSRRWILWTPGSDPGLDASNWDGAYNLSPSISSFKVSDGGKDTALEWIGADENTGYTASYEIDDFTIKNSTNALHTYIDDLLTVGTIGYIGVMWGDYSTPQYFSPAAGLYLWRYKVQVVGVVPNVDVPDGVLSYTVSVIVLNATQGALVA